MSDRTAARALLARYLRQRAELGDTELVLEHLSPGAVVAVGAALSPARPARREAAAAPPALNAPAPGASADEIVALPMLDAVRELALGCPRCALASTRRHVVFGEGPQRADLLIVGEAPGEDEDRTGRPFVGRAGRLLDLMLAAVGLPRAEAYICNVLKCRPPRNRTPQPDQIAACSPYLQRQIELVRPRALLALGAVAAQTLLGSDLPLGRLRGQQHVREGMPLIATYHPAALLRNPAWKRAAWDDLQRLRRLLA